MAVRDQIGVGNILWGNDFPHPEGTWPHTRDWIRIRFHDVPVEETRRILGLNALDCYSCFDQSQLRDVADRIGLSPDELQGQPVPPNPDEVDVAASRAG